MTPKETPHVAAKSPIPAEVEAGKTYYWCSCGLSVKQPFCDGSHKGTAFAPVAFAAEKTETVYFCACKHSKSGVRCDGSHKQL